VNVDLALGETAFADLTFTGLEALPQPGQERFAAQLLRSPGGAAITAIGAARLGLACALVSPLGADPEGDLVRAALAAEGIAWTGRTVERTAVTVVLPWDGDRAMATVQAGEFVTAEELEAVAPRAVVLSLPRLGLAPRGAWVYATTCDDGARAYAGHPPEALGEARALIVNAGEATRLAGAREPEAAARALAACGTTAVVTLGPDGAVAAAGEDLVHVPGAPADVVDSTGAGDLFQAAYIWADLRGAELAERLVWATTYASLSVRVPTGAAGAGRLEELIAATGMEVPGRRPVTALKEEG
jgi:sugar/nucleoside kinase (ribokinase family)